MPKSGTLLTGRRRAFGGHRLGESSRGNWMAGRRAVGSRLRGACQPGATSVHPFHLTTPALSLGLGSIGPPGVDRPTEDSYLVDSASSHMLVSKIKPCMSKYKQLYGETANGSLNQLSFI